ncbi:MAG: hypothetical protein AAGF01_28100 [Cyanobacteria bacterium P01_G01_bin.38]
MKRRKRRSQPGNSQSGGGGGSRARKRRKQIRRAEGAGNQPSGSNSTRRKTTDSIGKLDKASALAAVRSMGIAVDSKGRVDTAAARKVAEGAAVSAAKALGVNILKADGRIDTAKARQAMSQVLGFSVERDGSTAQQAAAQRAQTAAIEAAAALGADIRDANSNIDTTQAQQVAELALDLKVAKAKQLGRREALDALNISLNAATTADPLSRRAASNAIEKLLSASVLVDGKIDRRMALKAPERRP